MNWLKQNILYSIPDEIDSFADCSVDSYVIQCLSKHYSQDYFKHLPNTLIDSITTYTNELFGCINDSETNCRKLRYEYKSKIYSFVIDEGVDCFYEAYGKGDDERVYDFLIPRVKH